MMKDLLTQIQSAQTVLLSLNTRRLSFVYLLTALNKALKENNVNLKFFCESVEIKNELQNIDPYIQSQFVENIEKTSYFLKLKNNREVVEKFEDTSEIKGINLQFESKNSNISLNDFELKKDSQNYDLALFFGDISDDQIQNINSIKTIKHAHFLILKKENKERNNKQIHYLKSSHIQFFFDLLESLKLNNKNEIYTLLLTAILLETNNLSNSKTSKSIELVNKVVEKGGVFSIAQNYLSQNNIQDVGALGRLLANTKEIAKNVYLSEHIERNLKPTSKIIEDALYVLKKTKGHKLIILQSVSPIKTTYYLTTTHPRINLNLLKGTFAGNGYKDYFKFSLKENNILTLKTILDRLSLEHSIFPPMPQIIEPPKAQSNQVYMEERRPTEPNDPLKPADNIPEPLTFFKKNTPIVQQSNSPLPIAFS